MSDVTTPISWEKSQVATKPVGLPLGRLKFVIMSAVLVVAILFLIISGTANGGRYFITVNDLLNRSELAGKTVKISGVVLGETIKFDPVTKTISYTIANVPDSISEIQDQGGLAKALHIAATDPNTKKLPVVIYNQAMPDLLQNESQAIITGKLGSDGIFYADEHLFKCPSKYESDLPKQSQ